MMSRQVLFATLVVPTTLGATLIACDSPPPEPAPLAVRSAPTPSATASASVASASAAPAGPTSDPFKDKKFTLKDATVGLPGDGPLLAEIKTDQGTLECELFADKAPITVANFVGLARGTRPWKKRGKWVENEPAYNGTTFHRIVKGFMIQGGDPTGTGAGDPGYTIPDEIWEGTTHDRRGLLCMANRGPNTGSIQFFILDGNAPHLTKAGTYTVFGYCQPDSVVEALASVETAASPGKREKSKPVKPPKIERVTIKRGEGGKSAGGSKSKKSAAKSKAKK